MIGPFIVCQPINRAVRVNISYNQSEAEYDKAYCSISMTDIRDNLIIATKSEPMPTGNGLAIAIPGVTVMGIKSGEGRVIYQKLLPFAFVIQAALCCIPALM